MLKQIKLDAKYGLMLNKIFLTNQRTPKKVKRDITCSQVEKGGNFKLNKRDENENIQYYAGSENQIRMTR